MENKTKICVGVTACLILILSIIAVVLLFLMNKKDTTTNYVVDDLQKNLNSRGINEIHVSSSNNCPTGTSPMFNFNFPGTDTICSCTNDETGRKKLVSIYKSACIFVSGYTCKKIKMDPATMHRFKGKMLCAKYSQFTYEGYKSIPKNGTCPDANWRVCGHTQSRKLCLPKTEPCPINSIVIQKANMDPAKLVEGNYKTINLDNDYKMYVSNKKTGEQIITGFKASYDAPCMSPNETKVPADYEASGLDGNYFYTEECEDTLGTSSAIDNRWKKEVGYSRLHMFNDNGYFQNYESTSAVNMKSLGAPGHYIYSRGYSDWNRNCVSDPKKSIHENIADLKSDQEGESKWGLSIAAGVLLIVAIISALIWLVFTFSKNSNANLVKCCCLWLCIILLAAIVLLALLFVRGTRDYPDNSKHWMQEGCGDAATTGLLQNIVGDKTKYLKYIGWALGLTGLAWLLLCCLPCCFGKSRSNFDDDVMRSNRHSNYTELVEDDVWDPNAGYQAYPSMKQETVVYKKTVVEPEVKTTYVAPEPVTTTYVEKTIVQPERRVTTTDYVAPEPITTTTYVAPEPVTTTTYVAPEPVTTTTYVQPERRVTTTNYVAPEPTTTYITQEPQVTTRYVNQEPQVTTTYVNQDPQVTRVVRDPVVRTEYRTSQPEYTTTSYTQQPNVVRTNIVQAEPTSTIRYVDGTPTYTTTNIGSGVRTYDDQGRIVTRNY
jgi:hypothetical protein